MATKLDLKSLDQYAAPRGSFRVLDVPEQRYLMIDGQGDPNTSVAFAEAVETIFPVAYALKFTSKRELDRDYVVGPLEGVWFAEDMTAFTTARDETTWEWTLLNLVPEWIEPELVDAVVEQVRTKKRPARIDALRCETLAEGRSVQTLHVGSFADEGPVLAHLHEEYLPEHGLRPSGHHHEVYLSDFRKVEPAKLRTILRQPVTEV